MTFEKWLQEEIDELEVYLNEIDPTQTKWLLVSTELIALRRTLTEYYKAELARSSELAWERTLRGS